MAFYVVDRLGPRVSGDGATVAVVQSGSPMQAVIWNASIGVTSLGALPPSGTDSFPQAISTDGSTVVGHAWDGATPFHQAFRWDAEGGMTSLGALPCTCNPQSEALGVSEDGTIIVGWATFDNSSAKTAFIWNATDGMRRLEDVLAEKGITSPLTSLLAATGSPITARRSLESGATREIRSAGT